MLFAFFSPFPLPGLIFDTAQGRWTASLTAATALTVLLAAWSAQY